MLFVLIFGLSTEGQIRHEKEPYCTENGTRRVEIADGDATILGLGIGLSSLEDVQAVLGKSESVRVSKEEESDIALCYVLPADGTLLIFYSGSMGGWKDVTSFSLWSQGTTPPGSQECVRSAKVSRSLSTKSGLKLGLTEQEVREIAGEPTSRDRSSVKYDYMCRRKMTDEEINGFKTANNWDVKDDPYFDKTSWIEVRFNAGTASHIEVGRIESY